jgi:hypothetical protein
VFNTPYFFTLLNEDSEDESGSEGGDNADNQNNTSKVPESLQSNSNTQIPHYQNSNTINVNYHNPDTVNSGALSDQQSYQLYVQGRAKPAGPDGDLEDANVVGKISFYSPKHY